MVMFFPATIAGVVSHFLFHRFYPTSIQKPLLLSTVLLCVVILSETNGYVLQANTVIVVSGTFVASLLGSIIVYRLSPFHPLAKFPGPVLARVSKLWGVYNAWTGEQHRILLRLHREHGPFVRTGPNEMSVVDVRAITDVLVGGRIPKGEYYVSRQDQNTPRNLLTLTGVEHDNRRRLWNRGMGRESLQEYEGIISRRGNQLVERLRAESRSGNVAVDLVRWMDYFSFDFMGDMAFGGGFNMLSDGDDKAGLWNLFNRFAHITAMFAHVPWAVPMLMKVPALSHAVLDFRKFGVDAATARVRAGAKVKDLWYHLSDEAELEKVRPPTANVIADGTLAMVGGSDTTSSTLASFWFYILSSPPCYARLRKEIDEVYPPGSDPTDTARHEELVWLNACLNETLRLAPAFPTGGARQVPYSSPGAMIAGRVVPPGTQIYIPPFVMHRDPRYFSPSPEAFVPTRWLSSESSLTGGKREETVTINRAAFMPFSHGPTACVGQHLARMEMRMVVCLLMQKFDLSFAESFVEKDRWLVEWRDHVSTTRAPLWVKLVERPEVTA